MANDLLLLRTGDYLLLRTGDRLILRVTGIVPDVPGVEYKADAPRVHWKDVATQRIHWQDREEHYG